MSMRLWMAPAVLMLLFGADAARAQTSRAPDKVLTYKKAPGPDGQDQELKLHVYLPEGWKASDQRPAIILWFGGAFIKGDPKQFFTQAEYFASRGMVAISGEYRIRMGVPVSTEDARSTIRWMKTHAAELGIDPNKIAAGGGSAGGYLGTAVGTNVGPDAEGEDKTVSARPAALVLFNPALRAGGASSAGAASSLAPAPAPGGAGKAGKTEMDLAPPFDALSKDCPPSILFYGTTDNFIGPGRAFSEKALSLGVRSELWAAQGQGHGFFNGAPWTQATLEKADLFLVSLGMLDGTPTVKVDPKAVLVRQVPADAATQPTAQANSPEPPQPAPAVGKPAPAGDPAVRADVGNLLSVYEARVYKDAQGRSLNYRLLKPLDYDPKTKYPLVLFMHGKGASQGNDNQAQITAPGVTPAVTLFADPQVRQRFPAFVIVPQAPRNELWVADGVVRSLTLTESPTATLQLVVEAMDALQEEFSIDADRIYVTGTSYGGFGTWDLITRYPDKYAAAMPMAGGGDESKAPLIAKLPIWNFHGAKDPIVPVDRSRRMIAAIEKAGGKPKYTEYPTAAHADAWGKAFAEKDLLEWLFAQRRSAVK